MPKYWVSAYVRKEGEQYVYGIIRSDCGRKLRGKPANESTLSAGWFFGHTGVTADAALTRLSI